MKTKYQEKVLIAEDSDVIRDMETDILKEIGFKSIYPAQNGEEAMRILQTEKDIKLIISDWNMPILNGYDFLLRLRSDPELGRIPFIMATAHGERRQAAKALKAGVTHFITKPFSTVELKVIVDSVLGLENESAKGDKKVPSKSSSAKVKLRTGHIQITDHLILGIMKHMTNESAPKSFELETICMSSWNPVQIALEKGDIDAALLLAPIAMDMFGSGTDIRLLLFAHKNGSICVRAKAGETKRSLCNFLKGKIFFIPHLLSVHHMLSHMFLKEIGMNPGLVGYDEVDVFFEVVPPILMPQFMKKSENAKGFMVAEPIGTYAVSKGEGDLLYLSGDLWENHPCCVVVVRNDFIEHHEEAVQEFVEQLVEAGRFVKKNIDLAAKIAVNFLDPGSEIGMSEALLKKVLQEPNGIKTDDLFPVIDDLKRIQNYMAEEMGIGTPIDLEKFVDTRFAERALGPGAKPLYPSVFHGVSRIFQKLSADSDSKPIETPPVQKIDSGSVFNKSQEKSAVRFSISSQIKLKDRLIKEVVEFIGRDNKIDFPEVRTALNELLTNAIRHGNKAIPEKRVKCALTELQDQLYKIEIEDEGHGFNYERLMESIRNNPLGIKRGGYAVLADLCDHIEFDKDGASVCVYIKMRKKTYYEVRHEGDFAVLWSSGNITSASVNELKELLVKLLDTGHKKFNFDFEKVEDIDSISLTLFVVFVKMIQKQQIEAELNIKNCNNNLQNLFSMVRLDKYYMII